MATAAESLNRLIDRWNAMAGELRVIHRHLRRGAVSRALRALVALLDSLDLNDDESDDSAAPGDESDGDALVQQELVSQITEEPTAAPPDAPQAFSGRSFRLED